MNSGCAIVASSESGSTNYLVNNGFNGLIYDNNDFDAFYNAVVMLLNDNELCSALAKNAINTICNDWNAENAAKRLVLLSNSLLNKKSKIPLFSDGPCSMAECQSK